MHDAEALRVAAGPFEVVQQAPHHVARHRHAGGQRLAHRADVRGEVGGAVGVVHRAVGELVREGAAVLGDVGGRQAVFAVQREQQLGQAFGVDLPAHVGLRVGLVPGLDRAGGARETARVVVDADVVHGGGDGLHVARLHHRRIGAQFGHDLGRIRALEQRVGVPAPAARVVELRLGAVGRRVGERHRVREVQHDAQLGDGACGAQRLQRQAVAEHQVVGDLRGDAARLDARGESAFVVAQHRDHPRLVVRRDGGQPVAQATLDAQRVVDEVVHRRARIPAALVLQRLRQVPVVERQVRRQPARQQAVDEAVVERQALLVPGALAQRLHARPRDREAVEVDAQAGDQIEVGVEPVVVVAGDVAVARVGDRAGDAAEAIPDRFALAVLEGGAFDLEGARGHAPYEIGRELQGKVGGGRHGVGRKRAHLTAPAVRPAMSWRDVIAKRTMSGIVAMAEPHISAPHSVFIVDCRLRSASGSV